MPRKRAIDPPTAFHVMIPESDKGWIDAHLWSDLDGRVPHGAHRAWLLARLEEYRDWESLQLTPFGFPSGYFIRAPREVVQALKERLTLLEAAT